MANTIMADGQVLPAAIYNQNPALINAVFQAPETASPALQSQSVASAASITLPAVGMIFDIGGTTQINTIVATGNSGRVAFLRFSTVVALSNTGNILIQQPLLTMFPGGGLILLCDGTNWRPVASIQGTVAYSTVTASATITNTVTPTSFNRTFTIPANMLQVGSVIRIQGAGNYQQTANPTIAVQVRIGGTNITSNSIPLTVSNFGWSVLANLAIRTIGAGGTAGIGTGFIGFAGSTNSTNGLFGSISVNTTTALVIDIQVTWGAASASNIISLESLTVEILNPGQTQ